jgi:hypothetical protein
MRTLQLIGFALVTTFVAGAQQQQEFQPVKQRNTGLKILWGLSAAVLIAGASMDVASSYGHPEQTGYLRSPDGTFGARGAGLRFGIVGGGLLSQLLIARKHPSGYAAGAAMNFAVGPVLAGISIRNRRTIRESQLVE